MSSGLPWNVVSHPAFAREFERLAPAVRNELAAFLVYLEEAGPALGRPYADTLKGSKHSNMKELRFTADDGVWRAAFAFDPVRRARRFGRGRQVRSEPTPVLQEFDRVG